MNTWDQFGHRGIGTLITVLMRLGSENCFNEAWF